jgi:hypothetical protein
VALLAAFLALFPALSMWAAARLPARAGVRLLALAPAGVVARRMGAWLGVTGFPWLSLGDSPGTGRLAGAAGTSARALRAIGPAGAGGARCWWRAVRAACWPAAARTLRAGPAHRGWWPGLAALLLPLLLARGLDGVEWSSRRASRSRCNGCSRTSRSRR